MNNNIDYTRGCNTLDGGSGCATRMCSKLKVYDWLSFAPENKQYIDIVEIRFKNTRKEFFKNVNNLKLKTGDVVAVEASPGHDIGTVSLTGMLVLYQLKKNRVPFETEFRKIYRKAKPADIEKWKSSSALEPNTMLRARQIAESLKLDMKIGDVEYQGDGTKAIFYYIADERVDFRELIKRFAETFKIRIEMKQIGARQEAGRIGGIGSCGRELCCSTWITNFVSVTTVSAKHQELSLNPQKLAGQCGKLKCCLNYEFDSYVDAQKDFPDTTFVLETKTGRAYHQKTDIYKKLMWYSFDESAATNLIAVDVDRVHEIINLNKKGITVDNLLTSSDPKDKDILGFDEDEQNDKILGRVNSNQQRKKRKPHRRNNNNNKQTREDKPQN
ncbi:MAG: regulatory iron-sulfur-containing complex subunit RicT [Bacteroidales bacterium]